MQYLSINIGLGIQKPKEILSFVEFQCSVARSVFKIMQTSKWFFNYRKDEVEIFKDIDFTKMWPTRVLYGIG